MTASRLPRHGLLVALGLALVGLPFEALAERFRDEVRVSAYGTLHVSLSQGSVEVQTHDRETVAVDASFDSFGSDMSFHLTSDGKDARLLGRHEGWFRFGGRTRVRVQVPERYSLKLETSGGSVDVEDLTGNVEVRTSGGSIEVGGVTGEVRVQTSGGSIQIDDVAGHLRARTSGGGVRVSDVTGDVLAETSGGSIRVHDVGGHVRAETSGGSISARFEGEPAGLLKTSGGGIEVEFDERAGADLEARTTGGRVLVDRDLELDGAVGRHHVEAAVNGGGHLLRLETFGGGIRIRAR